MTQWRTKVSWKPLIDSSEVRHVNFTGSRPVRTYYRSTRWRKFETSLIGTWPVKAPCRTSRCGIWRWHVNAALFFGAFMNARTNLHVHVNALSSTAKIAEWVWLKNWWLRAQRLPWGNPRWCRGLGSLVNPQSQKKCHELINEMQ